MVLDITHKESKPLAMSLYVEGVGYEIKRAIPLMGGPMNVCDARYAYVEELDTYFPRLLFVKDCE